ncbi:MAG: hypothetical protein Q7S74_00955 [Nanoarchaeota archaeon]|nr:hypothetical protein [Nanoarchaeota archaeon]
MNKVRDYIETGIMATGILIGSYSILGLSESVSEHNYNCPSNTALLDKIDSDIHAHHKQRSLYQGAEFIVGAGIILRGLYSNKEKDSAKDALDSKVTG